MSIVAENPRADDIDFDGAPDSVFVPNSSAADNAFAGELLAVTPRLQRYARSLTRDAELAEDLVQDTLLRAWRARASFELGSNFKAWTFTILKRLHLSSGRRKRFAGEYTEALEQSLASQEGQTAAVILTEVEHALSRLPSEQHAALKMIAVEQLTYEEASEQTGVPVGTVKSRVARARSALVRLMTPEPPGQSPWKVAHAG